jgi:hypothetical protein
MTKLGTSEIMLLSYYVDNVNDHIKLLKVSKRYRDALENWHKNTFPITEYKQIDKFFPNMQTFEWTIGNPLMFSFIEYADPNLNTFVENYLKTTETIELDKIISKNFIDNFISHLNIHIRTGAFLIDGTLCVLKDQNTIDLIPFMSENFYRILNDAFNIMSKEFDRNLSARLYLTNCYIKVLGELEEIDTSFEDSNIEIDEIVMPETLIRFEPCSRNTSANYGIMDFSNCKDIKTYEPFSTIYSVEFFRNKTLKYINFSAFYGNKVYQYVLLATIQELMPEYKHPNYKLNIKIGNINIELENDESGFVWNQDVNIEKMSVKVGDKTFYIVDNYISTSKNNYRMLQFGKLIEYYTENKTEFKKNLKRIYNTIPLKKFHDTFQEKIEYFVRGEVIEDPELEGNFNNFKYLIESLIEMHKETTQKN